MTALLTHFYKDLVLPFQEEPPSKTCIYLFIDFMSPLSLPPVCVFKCGHVYTSSGPEEA